MARNAVKDGWRLLAFAALTAAVLALVCASGVEAQQAPKAAKKAAAKPAKSGEAKEGGESDQDEAAKAPAKKKKQDPAEAQRTIEAAAKLLEQGKSEQAAQALSGVVAGGNLPPAIMAKALLYRGIAYRQQKKPAQAVADLTSALWLKGGLAESERADALRQRTAAYQEAGLSESGEPIATAAVPAPSTGPSPRANARTAARSSGSESWGTSTTPAASASLAAEEPQGQQQAASTAWSGFSNPFAGLFGSSSPAAASPAAAPPASASPAPAPPSSAPINTAAVFDGQAPPQPERRPRSSSTWSPTTEVSSTAAPATQPSAAPATQTSAIVARQPSAVPAKAEGKFRIQLGMVRTQAEARALASKVLREHAVALSQQQPEIDQTVVGNMGSFYRVRVGPFASQGDGQAACAKVKGPGIDCMVVAQ